MQAKQVAELRALAAEQQARTMEQRAHVAEQRAQRLEAVALAHHHSQLQAQQLQAELDHTLKDLAFLHEHIAQIHASRLWRWTKPLRGVGRLLKGGAARAEAPVEPEAVASPEPESSLAKPALWLITALEPGPELDQLLAYVPLWQQSYQLVVLLQGGHTAVARWQALGVEPVLAPHTLGHYEYTEQALEALLEKQAVNTALVYGVQAKTACRYLSELGVATVAYVEAAAAPYAAESTFRELLFGATCTVMESEAALSYGQQALPSLRLARLRTLPAELSAAQAAQWWLSTLEQSRQWHAQDAQEVEVLLPCEEFAALRAAAGPELSDQQAAYFYLRMGKAGLWRKPQTGFHPAIYAQQQLEPSSSADPFVHYVQQGRPHGPWQYPLITPAAATSYPACTQPVALQIHAYYPDMLAAMLPLLNYNAVRPELFISVKSAADAQQVEQLLAQYTGTVAAIRVVPNAGRDIGPLFTAFGPELVKNYAFIGHLHTKQSWHVSHRGTIDSWQQLLLGCLLGDGEQYAMADAVLAAMQAQPELGMVFPDDPKVIGWDGNLPFAQLLAPALGLEAAALPEQFVFPVGTMFWARAEALAPFVALNLAWEEYPAEPLGKDGSMLHAMERLLGVVPASVGLQCGVVAVPGLSRL